MALKNKFGIDYNAFVTQLQGNQSPAKQTSTPMPTNTSVPKTPAQNQPIKPAQTQVSSATTQKSPMSTSSQGIQKAPTPQATPKLPQKTLDATQSANLDKQLA